MRRTTASTPSACATGRSATPTGTQVPAGRWRGSSFELRRSRRCGPCGGSHNRSIPSSIHRNVRPACGTRWRDDTIARPAGEDHMPELLQTLESRLHLSAGEIDPYFGNAGAVEINSGDAVVMSDGRLIVA